MRGAEASATRGRRVLGPAALLVLQLLVQSAVVAAPPGLDLPPGPIDDLSAVLSLDQRLISQSNPLIQSSGVKSTWGSVTMPTILINQDSPLQHFDLSNEVDVSRYSLPGLSSTDYHGIADESYSGIKWQIGGKGTLDYDTTRTSELTTSGLAVSNIRHLGWSVAPQASYSLTQTESLQLAGSYQESKYLLQGPFTNYDFWSASPTLQWAYSPLDVFFAGAQYFEFDTLTADPLHIRNTGVNVGWNRKISDDLSFSLSSGGIRSFWSFPVRSLQQDATSNAYTFNASLTYTGLQDTLSLTASRSPSPNGTGTETISTSAALSESHFFTERWEANGRFSFFQASYPLGTTASQNNSATAYLTAAPGATYHLTDEIGLGVGYQFRYAHSVDGVTRIDNDVMFDITIKLLPKSLSH